MVKVAPVEPVPRRPQAARRLPDPGAGDQRLPARVPGFRGLRADAAPGAGRDEPRLRAPLRQRAPRGVHDRLRGDRRLRGRARHGRRLRECEQPARVHLRAQRHGGPQPRRLLLRQRQLRAGRRDRVQRDGAPLEHGAVAAAGQPDGRLAALHRRDRRRPARSRPAGGDRARGPRAPRRDRAPVKHTGHAQSRARDLRLGARPRRGRRGRRRAVGTAPPRRRAGPGLRLLRLLGPQAARAERCGCAAGAARSCSRTCPRS